jgi:eukaryotic-like serine/threonine-protein kinase
MQVTLTVVAGPHSGRQFQFGRLTTFVIGRAPDTHFQLDDDPYVDPHHAQFDVDPPYCRVTDLESKAGIKVNGKKLSACELNEGDEVRVGQTVLRVGLIPAAPLDITGYHPEREIGAGDHGTVFLARRDLDNVRVAIKTLWSPGGESAAELFRGELARLAELDHPNLTRVYGGGGTGPLLYVVTEYVNGPNAEQIVSARGPMTVRAGVLVMTKALLGLAYAHQKGFTHGAIKPTNVLVGSDGKKRFVKLTDLGMGRALAAADGKKLAGDPLADQRAAAATLYFLIAGPPGDHPPPIRERRADVPEPIATAVDRAISVDPTVQYPGVIAFRQALLDGLPPAPADAPSE